MREPLRAARTGRDDDVKASSSARRFSGHGLMGVVLMTTEMTEFDDATEPSELSGIVMIVSILALLFVLVLVFA